MNQYKLKFKIGEFSKLCFVTVKTLRHYEKIGLLSPHEIDQWTGYRYYDASQISQMAQIKHYKNLGLSLEDIKDVFEYGESALNPALLDSKILETKADIKLLYSRLEELETLRLGSKKPKVMSKIVIRPLAGGVFACYRNHIKSYDELGPLCVNVIGPEMARLGCVCPEETAYCFTIDYNRNHNPNDIDIEYCEKVAQRCQDSDILKFRDLPVVENAVCLEHKGAYMFEESVAQIMEFIEKSEWDYDGEFRFNYVHGVWDCESVDDWLTVIEVPVKK